MKVNHHIYDIIDTAAFEAMIYIIHDIVSLHLMDLLDLWRNWLLLTLETQVQWIYYSVAL